MLSTKLYRDLHPGDPRPANVVRVRVPVRQWTNRERLNADYRCRNADWSVAVILIEADSSTLPLPRRPHVETVARCPFRGALLALGGRYEIVELMPVVASVQESRVAT